MAKVGQSIDAPVPFTRVMNRRDVIVTELPQQLLIPRQHRFTTLRDLDAADAAGDPLGIATPVQAQQLQ